MRHRLALVTLLSAASLGLLAAGCGGGGTTYSGTNPDTWAGAVCGAVEDWANGVKADSATMGEQIGKSSGDLAAVKARLVAFLQNGEKRSRTMVAKVHSAGPPAVKDGEVIQRDLEGVLGQARVAFANATTRAKTLPTGNAQALGNGLRELGSAVQKELIATGEEFDQLDDTYDNDRLNEATSEASACQKLSG
jgi:hypothetical protein